MCSWQVNQVLWNSVRKQQINYSTLSEGPFLWRVTLSAALHKEPCLRSKDSEGFLWCWCFFLCFSLFIFGLLGFFSSAVKPITETIRPFQYFYCLSPRLKSRKLNGTQFLQTVEILFLVLQSWNILVAFSHQFAISKSFQFSGAHW